MLRVIVPMRSTPSLITDGCSLCSPAQQVDQPCPFVRVKSADRPEVNELKAAVRANKYVSRMWVGVKYVARQHLPQHEAE